MTFQPQRKYFFGLSYVTSVKRGNLGSLHGKIKFLTYLMVYYGNHQPHPHHKTVGKHYIKSECPEDFFFYNQQKNNVCVAVYCKCTPPHIHSYLVDDCKKKKNSSGHGMYSSAVMRFMK